MMLEAFNKAILIKPDYPDGWTNLGSALNEEDNLEDAIKAYKKALSIKPDYADTITIWAIHSQRSR